jgi:hypothetical protein
MNITRKDTYYQSYRDPAYHQHLKKGEFWCHLCGFRTYNLDSLIWTHLKRDEDRTQKDKKLVCIDCGSVLFESTQEETNQRYCRTCLETYTEYETQSLAAPILTKEMDVIPEVIEICMDYLNSTAPPETNKKPFEHRTIRGVYHENGLRAICPGCFRLDDLRVNHWPNPTPKVLLSQDIWEQD